MGRLMALDIGSKRIGIAVSDPLGITAQGIESYKRRADRKDMRHIADLAKEYDIELIIAGMPANMDGSFGGQAAETRAFAEKLARRTGLPLVYEDERCTTISAQETLLEANVSRAKRKLVVDKLAAVIILQQYLSAHPNCLPDTDTNGGKGDENDG